MDLLTTEGQRQGRLLCPVSTGGAASPTAMLGARHPTPKTIPWLHGIPGKAAEVGSSRQRMDRAQAGRRGACVWCRGLAGWLVGGRKLKKYGGRQRHPLRVGGRRTGGLKAASAPPRIPVRLFPQACRVKVPTCAFIFKLHPSVPTCHSDPFYISSEVPFLNLAV